MTLAAYEDQDNAVHEKSGTDNVHKVWVPPSKMDGGVRFELPTYPMNR